MTLNQLVDNPKWKELMLPVEYTIKEIWDLQEDHFVKLYPKALRGKAHLFFRQCDWDMLVEERFDPIPNEFVDGVLTLSSDQVCPERWRETSDFRPLSLAETLDSFKDHDVKILRVNRNFYTDEKEDILELQPLLAFADGHKTLQEIDLSNNQLGPLASPFIKQLLDKGLIVNVSGNRMICFGSEGHVRRLTTDQLEHLIWLPKDFRKMSPWKKIVLAEQVETVERVHGIYYSRN